ncbi:MAG: cytochrome d ubiquinol oxidase subunit II, partial [Muribaculaceae bacterium]
WAPTRGLEMIADWRCLLLGFTVFFLARTQAALYFINNLRGDAALEQRMRRGVLINGAVFAVLFVAFAVVLLTTTGKQVDATGTVVDVDYLYFNNFIEMWWWAVALVLGVVLALTGIAIGAFSQSRGGIWLSGIGSVLVVVALFAVAGYNNTCYLPSNTFPQSSLTIANSSSSLYTLRTMAYVSIGVPFVIAYIAYVWRKMNFGGLSAKEVSEDSHQY